MAAAASEIEVETPAEGAASSGAATAGAAATAGGIRDPISRASTFGCKRFTLNVAFCLSCFIYWIIGLSGPAEDSRHCTPAKHARELNGLELISSSMGEGKSLKDQYKLQNAFQQYTAANKLTPHQQGVRNELLCAWAG